MSCQWRAHAAAGIQYGFGVALHAFLRGELMEIMLYTLVSVALVWLLW